VGGGFWWSLFGVVCFFVRVFLWDVGVLVGFLGWLVFGLVDGVFLAPVPPSPTQLGLTLGNLLSVSPWVQLVYVIGHFSTQSFPSVPC